MVDRDAAGLLHPVREHGVTGRCEDGDSSQHQILAKGQNRFSVNQYSVKSDWLRPRGLSSRLVRHTHCACRGGVGGLGVLLHHLVAGSPKLQKPLGLLIEALALTGVEGRFFQDAEDSFWTEVILVVEAVHSRKNIVGRQAGVFNVSELMSAFVDHLAVRDHESVLDGVVIKLGARICVRDGNLNGFDVELLGESNGVVNALVRLAGQTHDEVAVNSEPELVAILSELAGTLDGCALLDVLQNLP